MERAGCRYVFNLVKYDLDLDDAEALYKSRNNATKCINQSLAVVGEQIGLPFNPSMDCARHRNSSYSLKTRNLQRMSCLQVKTWKPAGFYFFSYAALHK